MEDKKEIKTKDKSPSDYSSSDRVEFCKFAEVFAWLATHPKIK